MCISQTIRFQMAQYHKYNTVLESKLPFMRKNPNRKVRDWWFEIVNKTLKAAFLCPGGSGCSSVSMARCLSWRHTGPVYACAQRLPDLTVRGRKLKLLVVQTTDKLLQISSWVCPVCLESQLGFCSIIVHLIAIRKVSPCLMVF